MAVQRRSFANFLSRDIGTAPTVIYTVPPNTTVRPASLYLSNKTAADIAANVLLNDPQSGDFVLGANIVVGAGETLLFFDQECYLRAGQSLQVTTSADASSDAFLNLEVFSQ